MATAALNAYILDTQLITNHNELVQELEQKYTDYIDKLLLQKDRLLIKLQKLLIVQRNYVKQTLSQQIIKNERRQKIIMQVLQPLNHSTNTTASTVSLPLPPSHQLTNHFIKGEASQRQIPSHSVLPISQLYTIIKYTLTTIIEY